MPGQAHTDLTTPSSTTFVNNLLGIGKFLEEEGRGIKCGGFGEFGDGVKHPVPISKRERAECKTLMLQGWRNGRRRGFFLIFLLRFKFNLGRNIPRDLSLT